MRVFKTPRVSSNLRIPFSWWIVLCVLSCAGFGEEDVNASAPLLSKQRNINVIKNEAEDKALSSDSEQVSESSSELETEESVGEVDVVQDGPDSVEQATPEPGVKSSSGGGGGGAGLSGLNQLSTWLSRASDKTLMSDSELKRMNQAWGVEEFEGQEKPPSKLSEKSLIGAIGKHLGKNCETTGCSDVMSDALASLGVSAAAKDGEEFKTGNWILGFDDKDNVEERERLLEVASRAGPVLLKSRDGYGIFVGSSLAGGRARAMMAQPQETLSEGEKSQQFGMSPMDGATPEGKASLSNVLEAYVMAPLAGPELRGVVESRPVLPLREKMKKRCKRARGTSVYVMSAKPARKKTLRIVTLMEEEIGPYTIKVIDPKGKEASFESKVLEGPPRSILVTIKKPKRGNYQLLIGESDSVNACKNVQVGRNGRSTIAHKDDSVWIPRRKWNKGTEGLYSAFVEHLFDHPQEDDRTWTKLQELIDNPDRNMLHNYFGQQEDKELAMEPDCADLPYFLRAYFAWKMRLPFAYHKCSGGLKGRPPECQEEIFTPQFEHKKKGPVGAFKGFLRQIASGVHSGNARTAPDNTVTDLYPVELSRDQLRPGVVYADPYGHLLVISKWVPQPKGGYGILMAGDAQPDGTVGRRRFWRGSFLFIPETRDVGAGFKAYRPVRYDKTEKTYTFEDNEKLSSRRALKKWSREQYKGTTDDFYDKMEGLINPRPLDPSALQKVLVDSLEESVNRRLNSVNNGEGFMKDNAYAVVEMPERSAIFQTVGPWEDFSTPSRDMRLLISMDTVVLFPDKVARNPERFGANTPEETQALVKRLRDELNRELESRTIEYMRSDGTPHTLSLKDLADRAVAFEMAYNPNDCVERRWGAPEGSEEYSSCKRFAPDDQRARMESYRSWFETRQRPPRGS